MAHFYLPNWPKSPLSRCTISLHEYASNVRWKIIPKYDRRPRTTGEASNSRLTPSPWYLSLILFKCSRILCDATLLFNILKKNLTWTFWVFFLWPTSVLFERTTAMCCEILRQISRFYGFDTLHICLRVTPFLKISPNILRPAISQLNCSYFLMANTKLFTFLLSASSLS